MLDNQFNLEDAKVIWQRDAIREGIAQGIEQGIEQGVEQGKEAVAENLLKCGVGLEVIVKSTELSIERIKEMAKKLNLNAV
jgi:predicted transposase/invertase (TIGR01784 family)